MMYLPADTPDAWLSFLMGYMVGAERDPLGGFSQWLQPRFGCKIWRFPTVIVFFMPLGAATGLCLHS